MNPARRVRAFTFIEISVVMVVMVLGALIVMPVVTSMLNSQRVESFRLDAERMFRSARSLAAKEGQDMEVKWDDGLVVSVAQTEEAANGGRSSGTGAGGRSSTPPSLKSSRSSSSSSSQSGSDQGGEERERSSAPKGLVTFSRGMLNGEEQSEGDWSVRFSPSGLADAGGIEMSAGGRLFWVTVDAQGKILTGSGELPDPGLSEWDAGELEQRTGG